LRRLAGMFLDDCDADMVIYCLKIYFVVTDGWVYIPFHYQLLFQFSGTLMKRKQVSKFI
jgi:hypothetical protein